MYDNIKVSFKMAWKPVDVVEFDLVIPWSHWRWYLFIGIVWCCRFDDYPKSQMCCYNYVRINHLKHVKWSRKNWVIIYHLQCFSVFDIHTCDLFFFQPCISPFHMWNWKPCKRNSPQCFYFAALALTLQIENSKFIFFLYKCIFVLYLFISIWIKLHDDYNFIVGYRAYQSLCFSCFDIHICRL